MALRFSSRFARVGAGVSFANIHMATKNGQIHARRLYNGSQTTLRGAMKTVYEHPNSGLKYLGLAGALGLGAMISYGLSRPAAYVPYDTRSIMSDIGGVSFAKMVRSRIMKTYGYLSSGLFVTGASAFLLFTRGWGYRVLMMNPLVYGIGTLLVTMGLIHATMRIDGVHNPGLKHAAWLATNCMMGLSLVGLGTMAGAQIVQQAALITGCIVGGMSGVALASPNDTFLQMGPYLGVGLGVVVAASLGGMFFPGSSLLMNISLYGGLGLFGLYTAHDAQRVLHDAQTLDQFEPISEQMGLYMDTINIFVRVVQILMMSQSRRR